MFVPGPNATAYFIAAAKNEQKVLNHIDLTSNWYRRYPLHDRTVHSKLLAMYLAAVLYIMPPNDSGICPPLWHPDLSLGNLLVSETGPAVLQGIIDWQHTSVLPYLVSYPCLLPCLLHLSMRGTKLTWVGLCLPTLMIGHQRSRHSIVFIWNWQIATDGTRACLQSRVMWLPVVFRM